MTPRTKHILERLTPYQYHFQGHHHFVLRCSEVIKDRVTRLRKHFSAFSALKNPPFSAFRHVCADAYDIPLIFLTMSVTVFIRTRLIPIFCFSHVSFLPIALCEEITTIYQARQPKFLIKVLAEEYQRDGVQLFIATHNYVLLKGFDIQKTPDDNVCFLSLAHDRETGQIGYSEGENYHDIVPNEISEAYTYIYDEKIRRSIGVIMTEGDIQIDFSGAISVRRFDDANHGLSHCTQAVDFKQIF
ncbi:hypothetical protein QUF80_17480 [Desulfococcaceae bacterium HSG8]|nr:hypothetical protein [Desulfococcaceae bacterium HSG8]